MAQQLEQIGLAVQKSVGAKVCKSLMLGDARHGIHRRAAALGQLQRSGTDPARGAQNQHTLARLELCLFEHVLRRAVGTGQGAKLDIAPVTVHREHFTGTHADELREGAVEVRAHPFIFQ